MKLSESLRDSAHYLDAYELDVSQYDAMATLMWKAADLIEKIEQAERLGPCMQTGSLLSVTVPEGCHYKGQFLRLMTEVES